jgi:hypothetical protein
MVIANLISEILKHLNLTHIFRRGCCALEPIAEESINYGKSIE